MPDFDPKQIMKAATDFAAEHVAECSDEILEWQNTGLLRDGKLRELGVILQGLESGNHLGIAESLTVKAALALVVNQRDRLTPIPLAFVQKTSGGAVIGRVWGNVPDFVNPDAKEEEKTLPGDPRTAKEWEVYLKGVLRRAEAQGMTVLNSVMREVTDQDYETRGGYVFEEVCPDYLSVIAHSEPGEGVFD